MQCSASWPVEITETIIDYVKYDTPTLSACALVCRSWAPRSLHHLTRKCTLTITSLPDLQFFASLLASKRSRRLFSKVELLHIIDNA